MEEGQLTLPVYQTARCNIVNVEQRILALANSWWNKASKNNGDIINFTYHHQSDNRSKMPRIERKSRSPAFVKS